ncbi:MAG: class I SAM-dependent rRNA methyltransferase [Luteibaculaceae bacterium]
MYSLKLKPGKEQSILRGHPWIFSGALFPLAQPVPNGSLVTVLDHKNNFIALGHYQDSGSITVRILSWSEAHIDVSFFKEKIEKAKNLRFGLGLPSANTNAYRLIHGEGDSLPGLIVDVYNGNFVIQCHSYGMFLQRHLISEALQLAFGSAVKSIYGKSADTLHDALPTDTADEQLFGELAEQDTVLEHGNSFVINWKTGQKTGFFLDQRENRKLLGTYSKNKKVLNTFCYSGGFSIYALQAGASEVVSVDVSQKAIDLTVENLLANGFSPDKNPCVKADVLPYLAQLDEAFDVIILDPPAFAKSIKKRHNALMAYKRINEMAFKKIKSGGIVFSFSCSQVVDDVMFKNTVSAAAIAAGKSVKILHQLNQPADHPIALNFPEGSYLKGLVLFVE